MQNKGFLFQFGLLIVLSLIMASCTGSFKSGTSLVQKRKYTKGFYWDMCKRNYEKPITETNNNLERSPSETTEMDVPQSDLIAMAPSHDSKIVVPDQEFTCEKNQITVWPYKSHLSLPSISHKKKLKRIAITTQIKSTEDENPYFNPLAVTAFMLYLLSVLLAFIAINEMAIALIFIAVLVQLASLIIAIIAIRQLNKNPEQKGRGLARAPIILFIIGILLSLINLFG